MSSLYTQYSSTNIRTTACPNCHKFADKYIEFDSVVTTIDLLLLKPQAFRHVVFNVLSPEDQYDGFHRKTRRMWILMTLFDVYLRWATAEKSSPLTKENEFILSLPVLTQYFCFLIYCLVDGAVMHLTIRLLASWWLKWDRPNALSTAMVISSSSKLFPILMIIWSYDIPVAVKIVELAVSFNTFEVLSVILQCGYARSILITTLAILLKTAACRLILRGLLSLLSSHLY